MTAKSFTSEQQAEFTNKMLNDFAQKLDKALRAQLSEKAAHVPSSTIRNMRYRIMEAKASDISAHYELYFQDSGRHVDMKKLDPGKVLPVDVILDWVRRHQNYFRRVPGYDRRSGSNIEQAKKDERIAAAIAISKSKGTIRRGQKRKRSQWINKTFYGFFGRLVNDFITEQSAFYKQAIAKEFSEGIGQNFI